MRRRFPILVLLLLAGAGGYWFWQTRSVPADRTLVLYGNIDTRELSLAFQDSGRVEKVLVEEGQPIGKGAPVARLDTGRLRLSIAQAQAVVEAQQAVVARLKNGTRPEQIASAIANRDAVAADARAATQTYNRRLALAESKATSQQNLDTAKYARDAAEAQLAVAQAALKLAESGSRPEDIAQAKAVLRADQAQLQLLQRQLMEATLVAPVGGIVRSLLVESGEMASAQTPIVLLALTDEKWVRTYVGEADLVRVRPGLPARVTVDGLDGKSFAGVVSFVSPVAEFTPKTIETADLRTSLVYEVRVRIADRDNQLRLGAPATVVPMTDFAPADNAAKADADDT